MRSAIGIALPAPGPRLELALVMLVAAVCFVALPLSVGGLRLSWDALNHHIYLGWIADGHRFDLDFLPAGYQGLIYPYLYWPVYQLALGGASAVQAGVVLALLYLVAVPPVWLIARSCMPGVTLGDALMRALAVLLGLMSAVVISLFDTTANDFLAAAPLIWAIALALLAAEDGRAPARAGRLVLLSGALAGMSVAFKLSGGPIAILLPLLWTFARSQTPAGRLRDVALGCAATLLGFLVCYGYWGWQLWSRYGNPMYPFYDAWFEPLRRLVGWAG